MFWKTMFLKPKSLQVLQNLPNKTPTLCATLQPQQSILIANRIAKLFLLVTISSGFVACGHLPVSLSNTELTSNPVPVTSTMPASELSTFTSSLHLKDDSPIRHEFELENGLKVIIKEDHRAPVVMTQIWYKVGSTDEPTGKGGISHLLEHMMFKGTDKVSGADFDRLIAKFGGNHNAFTSYDYTGYYEMFPANRVALALELEADRMNNLDFNSATFQNEFVKERQVVMEERRQRTDTNPMARAYEKFRMLALPESPKGQPIIGPMQQIQNIEIEDLQAWYNTWYAPNNATLVIVGDVNPKQAMAHINTYFHKKPPKPLPTRPSVAQSSHRGYQKHTLVESVNVPTLLMAFNVPTLPSLLIDNQDEATAYDLLMLQYVLDGGYAARFERSLIREQGVLASIGSSYSAFERGDGLFIIQATVRDGVSLAQAETAIMAEIDKLKTQPVNQTEWQRARNSVVTSMVFSQDSMAGQAQLIGSLQVRGLDDRLIEQLPNNMSQVSTEDIHAVANTYLTKDNLTVMYVEPKE